MSIAFARAKIIEAYMIFIEFVNLSLTILMFINI